MGNSNQAAVLVLAAFAFFLLKKDDGNMAGQYPHPGAPVILVTGGGGYIGSHIVVEVLNTGYNVVVVDNLVNACRGKNNQPEALNRVQQITNKTVIFYEVDVLDKAALGSVFDAHKIDTVIHLAALKAVGESVELPLQYYKNNVGGTVNLLEVMKEKGVKRFLFSSSATVYGLPKKLPLTEEHVTGQECTNPYGKSKYFTEEVLHDLTISDPSWSVLSLRYFNPVGAHISGHIGEDPEGIPNNLMPFIAQVAIGQRDKLKVYGNDYDTLDGTGVRDYIHITDLAIGHVKALDKLMEPAFKGWKVYNLGTGTGYSVLQVVNAFKKASGREIPFEIVGRRAGDIATSFADPAKANKELGWKAERGLEDMCADMWRWQTQNPKGFRSDK